MPMVVTWGNDTVRMLGRWQLMREREGACRAMLFSAQTLGCWGLLPPFSYLKTISLWRHPATIAVTCTFLTKLSHVAPHLGGFLCTHTHTSCSAPAPLTLCPHQGQSQASPSFPPQGAQLPMEPAHGLETLLILQAKDEDHGISPA